MTQKELDVILEKHKKWIDDEAGGERADLSSAKLRFADLRFADLSFANLNSADLSSADLRSANLNSANLNSAKLNSADLSSANLNFADLSSAKLRFADLRFADLRFTDLRFADLNSANLSSAKLNSADLRSANLNSADLSSADLRSADLRSAKNIPYISMACPEEGAFYGYKKVSGYIVKLFIPKDAKRSSATSRKCRCSYAKVISITLLDGSKTETKELVNTQYSPNITYKVGEYVYPNKFDDNRWNECSNGIHFFINRQEAVNY